jgi:hypothetical protein
MTGGWKNRTEDGCSVIAAKKQLSIFEVMLIFTNFSSYCISCNEKRKIIEQLKTRALA